MTQPAQPAYRRIFSLCDEADNFDLELDNTAFGSIQSCSRHAFNELVLGRIPTSRAALDYGAAIHVALEHWHLNNDLPAALALMRNHWSKLPKYDMGWRTYAQAVTTVSAYVERYKQPYSFFLVNDKPLTEHAFRLHLADINLNVVLRDLPRSVFIDPANDHSGHNSDEPFLPIRSVRVFFTGRMDLLAKIKGKPVLVDFKTTSIESKSYWDYFQLSPQFTGYLHALNELGISCDEFLIDVLKTRPPTATGTEIDFARQSFKRNPLLMARWKQDFLHSVHAFLTQLSTGITHNYNSCITKYGNCTFFDVCTMPTPDSANNLLNSSFYASRTWNPLDER